MQFERTLGATEPPTNRNFEAFEGTMARATWAQRPLRWTPWVLKYSYYQMITQTHPRGDTRVSKQMKF